MLVMSFDDTATYGNNWVLVPYSAFDATAFGNNQLVFNQDFNNNWLSGAPGYDPNTFYNTNFNAPGWDTTSDLLGNYGYDVF